MLVWWEKHRYELCSDSDGKCIGGFLIFMCSEHEMKGYSLATVEEIVV